MCSLAQENLNNFVPRWMGLGMRLRCEFALIPCLGELKPSTTTITVDLDTSGQTRLFIDVLEFTLDTLFQFLLGNQENSLGSSSGSQRQWDKGANRRS